MRRHFGLLMLAIIVTMLSTLSVNLTTDAQDNIPILVTNTPRAPQQLTPTRPTNPPGASMSRFALRLWLEADMLDVLLREIALLERNDAEGALAIQLLQHELGQRFPGAPHNSAQRELLFREMLVAPRGMIDMRSVARAFIEDRFDEAQPSFDRSSALIYLDGLSVNISSANLNGVTPRDALVHVRYPSSTDRPAQIRYEDYFPMQIDAEGNYRVMPGSAEMPAAPFFPLAWITLERLADINQDGTDEAAIAIGWQDQFNFELSIFGWRGDQMVNLIDPSGTLLFRNIRDWPLESDFLLVLVARIEDPAWGCIERRPDRWTWQGNFFRQPQEASRFFADNSIACQLSNEEPLFAQSPDVAINTIRNIIGRPPPEDISVDRAEMMIAMLMALDGQREAARIQAENLQARAEPDSWLFEQTTAFLTAIDDPDQRPIQICRTLVEASVFGACDMGEVLGRLLRDQPLRRDLDIASQLEFLGINVVEVVTVTEIGRLDRQVAHIDMGGDYWWAFAPLNAEVYTTETAESLSGDQPIIMPPEFVTAPRAVHTLLSNDYRGTLAVIDNAQQQFPNVPLSAQLRYMQVLSLELLGDRTGALEGYYELWSEYPDTVWGQVAAAHLELRG